MDEQKEHEVMAGEKFIMAWWILATHHIHPTSSQLTFFTTHEVKITVKGRRFQDAEIRNISTKISAVPLDAFNDCYATFRKV